MVLTFAGRTTALEFEFNPFCSAWKTGDVVLGVVEQGALADLLLVKTQSAGQYRPDY